MSSSSAIKGLRKLKVLTQKLYFDFLSYAISSSPGNILSVADLRKEHPEYTMHSVISEMELGKTTLRLEDQCSEIKLETETELPKTEQLIHEPPMEQKSNHEEQSNPAKDVPDLVSEVSPNISNNSSSVDILYNDKLDYLEVQKVNNIMRAAYKEFMTIAIKANDWVFHPPAVGSVEDLQEMFHSPPPHGSTVECSVESAILPISSRSLISTMMDAERWASMFSNIICFGSDENVLTPAKAFWSSDTVEVTLINAQFRLPAEFLPRWSTRFLRFKKTVTANTCAIFDVSADYFEDTTLDPTQRIEYRRRPSGVIIRQCGLLSEVIWVENAEVQEINIPQNMCSTSTSTFPLTAKHWISMLSHTLKRRRSKVVTSEMYDETADVPDLLTIAENLERVYLETVSPFPRERTWDLCSNDRIRILRDMKANCIGFHNDYIASSTIHIPETPIRLLTFLDINNVKLQWSSIKSPAQLKLAVAFFTADESSCISLRAKIETGDNVAFEGHEFFLQETSVNEYCSFVLSSQMTEADVHISLLPRFCRNSVFLRPAGFAIMPAGPGGLQSKASLVTICIRRELKNMEVDQAIEAMSSHMNAVIDQITNIQSPNVTDDEDSEQNTL